MQTWVETSRIHFFGHGLAHCVLCSAWNVQGVATAIEKLHQETFSWALKSTLRPPRVVGIYRGMFFICFTSLFWQQFGDTRGDWPPGCLWTTFECEAKIMRRLAMFHIFKSFIFLNKSRKHFGHSELKFSNLITSQPYSKDLLKTFTRL